MLRIGLDIGHSSVKATYSWASRGEIGSILFPTLVIPAFRLMDERAARAAKEDTVDFEGQWFVGETAELQGKLASFSGQDRDWVFTKTHDVLVLSALDRIKRQSGYGLHGSTITIGLPAAFYASQKTNLRTRLLGVIAQYYGEEMTATMAVRIQPQPYGPVYLIATASDGSPSGIDLKNESWGVVEVGHFTTDYILIKREQIVDHSSGSSEGFRGVYERMTPEFSEAGFSTAPEALTRAILTRRVSHYSKEIDVGPIVDRAVSAVAGGVLSDVQRLFGQDLPSLKALLVAGGAAPVIAPILLDAYPNATLVENPRFAVAEGFRRHSCIVAQQ
jgi:plasmid segregation protein ParM